MAAAPNLPTAVPPAPQPAPLSEAARIFDTFIAPSKTFTDLRRNPSWWAPWLLVSVVSILFFVAIDRQIGFERISKTEMSRSSRAEQIEKLPADQRAKQLQITTAITRDFCYATPLIILISYLLIAGVLMGIFNVVAGAAVKFKTALAIVVYAGLPGIIGALLGIISLFAGVDPAGFNIRNPVATNPAYFMDPTGNKFLYGMASALDVFLIWTIVLTGIGFAGNSKVKRTTAIGIVAGSYLVYKLISSGLGAAFS
ncbi:MAG: YIP1 family protein [Terriglobales bacterium]